MNELLAAGRGIDWVGVTTVWGLRLLFALLILLAGLWLARRLSNALKAMLGRVRVEPILAAFFGNVVHAVLLVLVLVTMLDALGVPPTSLLAVMGAAGLAVGLAMKDSLANIASGVMLIVLRPFRSGDVVEIAGITGVVEQVRLFQTVLRSFENHGITLPNGQITAAPITNFTAHPTRRIDIPVGVAYADNLRGARETLMRIAGSIPAVMSEPAPEVVVSELADNSVNLMLRAWVPTSEFAASRSALLEAVHEGLPAAGFSIPFPQRDVYLHLPEDLRKALLRERSGEPQTGSESESPPPA